METAESSNPYQERLLDRPFEHTTTVNEQDRTVAISTGNQMAVGWFSPSIKRIVVESKKSFNQTHRLIYDGPRVGVDV